MGQDRLRRCNRLGTGRPALRSQEPALGAGLNSHQAICQGHPRGQKRICAGGWGGRGGSLQGRGGAACSLLPRELVVPPPSGPATPGLLTGMNTGSRLSPGGLFPPTPETTRCSAAPRPTQEEAGLQTKPAQAGPKLEGSLLPDFLSSLLPGVLKRTQPGAPWKLVSGSVEPACWAWARLPTVAS